MYKNYSVCRSGLEVYKTDEENFKPYISTGAKEDTSSSESEDSENSSLGYTYHRGEANETYHYANLFSANREQDYKEMNSSATVTVPIVDKNQFYKGVRVTLKEQWEEPGQKLAWKDLSSVLFGFITSQTYNEENVELKIDGASKLLDQKFIFEFNNMKRSKILEEVIKTAGLVPMIDTSGLDDDVTTFKSSSDKKESSSSSASGGEGEEIDSLVKTVIGSETDDKKKMELVHKWVMDNTDYDFYECTKYDSPEKCLKNKSHLNCADTSRLERSMMSSAGLDAQVVHGDYHFWVVVTISGTEYACDGTNSKGIGYVWIRSAGTSQKVSAGGPYHKKNGENPDC